eukprot:jgi/Mesvir1/15856/Mv26148-RA.1
MVTVGGSVLVSATVVGSLLFTATVIGLLLFTATISCQQGCACHNPRGAASRSQHFRARAFTKSAWP